jgi:hypothetical protein
MVLAWCWHRLVVAGGANPLLTRPAPSPGRLPARPALKFFGIATVLAVLVGAWLSSVSLEETSGIEVVTELRGGEAATRPG